MAKSYSSFNYNDIKTLNIVLKRAKLFDSVEHIAPSARLVADIEDNLELPFDTEKAKSELLVVPVLNELRRNNKQQFTVFSGYAFDVDKSRGLNGHCDYILSQALHSPTIESPIICVVEAKNDAVDSQSAIAQCVAEMYAVHIFNQDHGKNVPVVYGITSTGLDWMLLRMENMTVEIDTERYYLKYLSELLGALQTVIDVYK